MFSKTTNWQVKLAFLFLIIGPLVGCNHHDNSDSMKECEKMHSYETCLHILR